VRHAVLRKQHADPMLLLESPVLLECMFCSYVSVAVGITIRMNVVVEDRPTTCKLIFGRIKLGVHKRTVMR
jgi:hypothetical protein